MSILKELSSSLGLRTQEPNDAVAMKCLARPELLEEIAGGLADKNPKLVGDCAEVMTKVAESDPTLVAPHASVLLGLLGHKNGRVRWESAHALGLIAAQAPSVIERSLGGLTTIIKEDKSVIVRDYVIDAVAGYGATSKKAAERAFPVLREATQSFEGKHAARILSAMPSLLTALPKLGTELSGLAEKFLEHPRAGVRKAAKALHKIASGGTKPQKP